MGIILSELCYHGLEMYGNKEDEVGESEIWREDGAVMVLMVETLALRILVGLVVPFSLCGLW